MVRQRFAGLLVLLMLLMAASQFAGAALIYAKAWLAPVLIEVAYEAARADANPRKPWPWSDTWPIARLQMQRLHIDRLVLEGDSGNTLAFGPGMAAGQRPGEPGLLMISAHRDTHFRFLQNLLRGDEITLEYRGRKYRYRVTDTEIADARDGALRGPLPDRGLLLVTCYPFDAIVSGGPRRYVVIAEELPPGPAPGTTSL